jgi:bacteriocin-like protein
MSSEPKTESGSQASPAELSDAELNNVTGGDGKDAALAQAAAAAQNITGPITQMFLHYANVNSAAGGAAGGTKPD